jgi:hypothetical protein
MTQIPTLIRRWKILMTLTLALMAATSFLMVLHFSVTQVVLLLTQVLLLLTQNASLKWLRTMTERAA